MPSKYLGAYCLFAFLAYVLIVLFMVMSLSGDAEARPHRYERSDYQSAAQYRKQPNSAKLYRSRHRAGPRPAKWCGWWMRTIFGGNAQYNRARLWANRGRSAGGPRVGAVVVWRNHVGIITGRARGGKWVVKSGNDSNRVRERPRSLARAIAFRIL